MANSNDVIREITKLSTQQVDLMHRLYGQENDLGDIPTIIQKLDGLNGRVRKNEGRIKLALVLGGLAVCGTGGGAVATKILEMW